ncbi:MAG: thioesterase family protein [Arachidicoccus sp.]|nr:thioesterase family protein [Arachidicoccus sp.]
MENVYYKGQIIWSMIDLNGHLRHSVYADFAAQSRVNFLFKSNLMDAFKNLSIGPVLFREELIYLKELHLGEEVIVTAEVSRRRKDHARYSIRSVIYRADGLKSAIVNSDGAWFNLKTRKIVDLPEELSAKFSSVPRTEDYEEYD